MKKYDFLHRHVNSKEEKTVSLLDGDQQHQKFATISSNQTGYQPKWSRNGTSGFMILKIDE